MQLTALLPLALAAPLASAHFVLQWPSPIPYDDTEQATGPCGGADPADRSGGVTDWPVGGQSVKVITTHGSSTWEYRAAVAGTADFVPLTPLQAQTGVGNFCTRDLPGPAGLVGREAVLQVIQHTHHGSLYGCAAVRFVSGGPATPPAICTNSTGVTASW